MSRVTSYHELVPADELKPAAYNPRRISPVEFEKLKDSIRRNGFVEPAVVNRDGTIVGGHQRVKAAQALGMGMIPCVRVDLDRDAERALNLALNRISGEWDEAALAEVLRSLPSELARDTGFDDEEVARALRSAEDAGERPEAMYGFSVMFPSREAADGAKESIDAVVARFGGSRCRRTVGRKSAAKEVDA